MDDVTTWYTNVKDHHITLLPCLVCVLISVYLYDLALSQLYYLINVPGASLGEVGLDVDTEVLVQIAWGSLPLYGNLTLVSPVTFFSYAFHHLSIYHISTNLLMLFAALRLLEERFGSLKVTILFFPPLFAGSLIGYIAYRSPLGDEVVTILAGASSVCYGYLAVIVGDAILNFGFYRSRWLSLLVVVMSLLIAIALDASGVSSAIAGEGSTQVAVAAHVAGVASSLLAAIVLLPIAYPKAWERFLKPTCFVLLLGIMGAPAIYLGLLRSNQ